MHERFFSDFKTLRNSDTVNPVIIFIFHLHLALYVSIIIIFNEFIMLKCATPRYTNTIYRYEYLARSHFIFDIVNI